MEPLITHLTTRQTHEIFSTADILINIGLSIVLSFFIALAYTATHVGNSERKQMMHTIVLLSLTIAVAMMVIGNSLARAFGLVGAVSIIRFRTAMDNPRDIALIFISIIVGMASGLGFYFLSFLFTAVAIILLVAMERFNFGGKHKDVNSFFLILEWKETVDPRIQIRDELERWKLSSELYAMQFGKKKKRMEYLIKLQNGQDPLEFYQTLKTNLQTMFPDITVAISKHEVQSN